MENGESRMEKTGNAPDLPAAALSPPWVVWAEKLKALFAADPAVGVAYDDASRAATVRVEGAAKAEAISRLLPEEVGFGNVALRVRVVPANAAADAAATLRAAFGGNPAVADVLELPGPLGNPVAFAVFAREPVDVPCDNAADPAGAKTLLMEEIAREVLGDRAGAFLCTAPRRAAEPPRGS